MKRFKNILFGLIGLLFLASPLSAYFYELKLFVKDGRPVVLCKEIHKGTYKKYIQVMLGQAAISKEELDLIGDQYQEETQVFDLLQQAQTMHAKCLIEDEALNHKEANRMFSELLLWNLDQNKIIFSRGQNFVKKAIIGPVDCHLSLVSAGCSLRKIPHTSVDVRHDLQWISESTNPCPRNWQALGGNAERLCILVDTMERTYQTFSDGAAARQFYQESIAEIKAIPLFETIKRTVEQNKNIQDRIVRIETIGHLIWTLLKVSIEDIREYILTNIPSNLVDMCTVHELCTIDDPVFIFEGGDHGDRLERFFELDQYIMQSELKREHTFQDGDTFDYAPVDPKRFFSHPAFNQFRKGNRINRPTAPKKRGRKPRKKPKKKARPPEETPEEEAEPLTGTKRRWNEDSAGEIEPQAKRQKRE